MRSCIKTELLSGVVVLDVFFVMMILLESEVPRRLINFSESRSFQGLLPSFNPIKFTPDVFSNILKVFQKDILLSGVLLSIIFDFDKIIGGIQSLALENFGILLSFLKF